MTIVSFDDLYKETKEKLPKDPEKVTDQDFQKMMELATATIGKLYLSLPFTLNDGVDPTLHAFESVMKVELSVATVLDMHVSPDGHRYCVAALGAMFSQLSKETVEEAITAYYTEQAKPKSTEVH